MDPNANLAEQDDIMRAANGRISHVKGDDRRRLRELQVALWEWIRGGGFKPIWDDYPYGTTRFVVFTQIGR